MKKTVLVTGSSIGLGAKVIEKFAQNNYNVVINYMNHEDEALELMKNIKKIYNVDALCIRCDISNENDIKEMFNKVISTFGNIDVLVNNAAFTYDSLFENKTKELFMKTLEINLVGTFLVSRIFGDYMFNNKNGSIINISSTNGIDTYYEYSLDYDASKAGIINLSHNLSNHYSPYVRVNTICPGWMNTSMNKDLGNNQIEELSKSINLKRFANPMEVANVIYFLSTEEASYVNDSVIRVDGGSHA